MSDLIYRQDAIDAILVLKHKPEFNSANSFRDCYVLTEAEEAIKHLPSAQQEQKQGKWSDIPEGTFCTVCNYRVPLISDQHPHYCPNCGAKMKGEQE